MSSFNDTGLRLTVYDKDMKYRGDISDPLSVDCTLRHNEVSTASIVIASDHRLINDVLADGARLVMRSDNSQVGYLMGGWIESSEGLGPDLDGQFTFTVQDYFSLMKDVLGWVVPTAPIDQQGAAGTNDVKSGPAETVVKYFVQANMVQRLGLPVTVAADQARGAHVNGSLRFATLFDGLIPTDNSGAGVDAAGIGVTIRQDDASKKLVVDCYAPSATQRVLSVDSGVVVAYKWDRSAPIATRVVVGGAGEAQLRTFRFINDTARETQYGRIRERFQDARDLAAEDSDLLYQRGQQVLDDGRALSGLSITLSETSTYIYGISVRVGDSGRILINGATVGPDIFREATITWNTDDGLQGTPKVGDVSDDPDDVMAKAVQTIARGRAADARR